MICSDEELSGLDERLGAVYRRKLSSSASSKAILGSEQQGWLASRDKCENKDCVRTHYVNRISELIDRGRTLFDIAPRFSTVLPELLSKESFCAPLLKALRRGRGVVVVEPTVTAESSDDPKFRGQIGQCESNEFVEQVAIEPRTLRDVDFASLSKEERRALGPIYAMNGGFRFYKINIDNDASNGDELVLYGAAIRPLEGDRYDRSVGFSRFNVINTKQCKISNSAQVPDVLNRPDTFAGILSFEDRYYIFEGTRSPTERLWSVMIQRQKPGASDFVPACFFQAFDRQ